MNTTVAAPLAVWETRNGFHKWEHSREAYEWAQAHWPGADETYRTEFYLGDAPFAKVFRYATDEQGRRYFDPETDWAAVQEPVTVPLTELPPPHLLVHQ